MTRLAGLALLLLSLTGCAEREVKPIPLADRVLILKSAHTMTLYAHGTPLRTYRVALGRGDGSAKNHEGDHNTPEGTYVIDARNPHSRFHRALHVSYPNAMDRAHAAARHEKPGGDIMIHGLQNGLGWLGQLHQLVDWTDGCVAVTDAEMDEVWSAVSTGTRVDIKHD